MQAVSMLKVKQNCKWNTSQWNKYLQQKESVDSGDDDLIVHDFEPPVEVDDDLLMDVKSTDDKLICLWNNL